MTDFKYFTRDEFACKETGENKIKDDFIHWLDDCRQDCGFPFAITSGYRSPRHSKEKNKPNGPGQHSEGHAADIACTDAVQRMRIVTVAIKRGAKGIGVAKTFVHVDLREGQRVMWTY